MRYRNENWTASLCVTVVRDRGPASWRGVSRFQPTPPLFRLSQPNLRVQRQGAKIMERSPECPPRQPVIPPAEWPKILAFWRLGVERGRQTATTPTRAAA